MCLTLPVPGHNISNPSCVPLSKAHDDVYTTTAFPTPELRQRIEGLGVVNKFVLANPTPDAHRDVDGKAYDPAMRQKCADGSRVIAPREVIKSEFLRTLDARVAPVLLNMDDGLRELAKTDATKADVEKAVDMCIAAIEGGSGLDRGILVKLGLLAMKQAKTKVGEAISAAALWREITSHTDEMYEVRTENVVSLHLIHLHFYSLQQHI